MEYGEGGDFILYLEKRNIRFPEKNNKIYA